MEFWRESGGHTNDHQLKPRTTKPHWFVVQLEPFQCKLGFRRCASVRGTLGPTVVFAGYLRCRKHPPVGSEGRRPHPFGFDPTRDDITGMLGSESLPTVNRTVGTKKLRPAQISLVSWPFGLMFCVAASTLNNPIKGSSRGKIPRGAINSWSAPLLRLDLLVSER